MTAQEARELTERFVEFRGRLMDAISEGYYSVTITGLDSPILENLRQMGFKVTYVGHDEEATHEIGW
jgi:hypothetical protein